MTFVKKQRMLVSYHLVQVMFSLYLLQPLLPLYETK